MMENIQKIRQLWDTDEQMTLHRPILETPRVREMNSFLCLVG